MDETRGVLTTQKIQALLDTGFSADVRSRRDLARALAKRGEQISTHGVEAWFRHVDSNYNFKRESLAGAAPSYPIPKRRWAAVIEAFGVEPRDLDLSDAQFRKWCLEQSALRSKHAEKHAIAPAPSRQLVARDAEYAEFLSVIDRATAGAPSMLLVEGDAGVGKSRLLGEFNAALDGSDCIRLGASCAEDSEIPLLPIVDLIRLNLQKIAVADGASVEQFEDLQKEYVAAQALGQNTPQFFVQFAALLLDIAQRRTLVITLDDLHWADDATRRFLQYLWQSAESAKGNRLALIGTLRSGIANSDGAAFVERLRRFDDVKTLRIGPMNLEDLGAVLDMTADLPVSERLRKFIWEQSLGNAFYALEILRSLKQDKHLFVRNGYLDTIATPEQLQLHGDVTAIFCERFGAFTEATQSLLQYAAALANNFTLEQIQLLFPKQPLQQLLDSIEESEREGFLVYDNDRFRFTHPIIRQAIYRLASETRRARIHCNIADHVRHDTRSQSEYRDIDVAQHLTKGRMLADSKLLAAYCYKAAQLARKLAAWDQVILFSRTALGVEDPDALRETQRADLLTFVGGGLHQSGRPVEALEVLDQAKQRFANFGDHLSYALVLSEMGRIRGNFGIVDPNEKDDLDEMQRLAAQLAPTHPHAASRLLDSLAARYMYSGEADKALEFSLQALDAVRLQAPSVERALAAIGVGLAQLYRLDIDAAETYLNEGLDTANACAHMPSAARALQRLTLVHFVRGALSNVALGTKRIREVGRGVASTGEFTLALAMQLGYHALRAEFAAAESIFDEGMNLARSSGYVWGKPHLIAAYCYLCHRRGKPDAAIATAEELARGDRRAFERLVAQIRFYVAAVDSGVQAGEYRYLSFDGAPYDVMRCYRYGMDLRVAVRSGDRGHVRTALAAIEFAAARGVLLTPGWPLLVPALLAEGRAYLGETEAARYHFTVATDAALRLGLNAEIEPLLDLGNAIGLVDDHAHRSLLVRRQALLERAGDDPQAAA